MVNKEAEEKKHAVKVSVKDLDFYYNKTEQALHKITTQVYQNQVMALIGPSGCGKSTFLRVLNRMNDIIDNTVVSGEVLVDGKNIYAPESDVVELRKQVGMVFQKSNPFPKTIFENIAYGPKIHGIHNRAQLEQMVEQSLKRSFLWDEVKDRLHSSAMGLSGGQQQRLCIARALAINPDVILMDEPTSALDPRSTAGIEDLIRDLSKDFTIVIVTHNMQQAARVSDQTAFFYEGKLVEYGVTKNIFTNPEKKQTEDYITGRFG